MGVCRLFHFPIISFYWFYYISIRGTIAGTFVTDIRFVVFPRTVQRLRLLY